MSIKTINGDLIKLAKQGKFNVIGHSANCFHTMGSGIAKTIKSEFPEAYKADLKTQKGFKQKLGSISCAKISENLTVINMYTQFSWSRKGPNGQITENTSGVLADYDAIRNCLKSIKLKYLFDEDIKIGFPMFGAGLARGDWNIIEGIIKEELNDMDITIVKYDK